MSQPPPVPRGPAMNPPSASTYDEDNRYHCHHCKTGRESEERYSFGAYAGRWCDQCWPKSGYRDAADPEARFDPMDAGESMDGDLTPDELAEWDGGAP